MSRKLRAEEARRRRASRRLWLWGGLGAVISLAAAVAIVVGGSEDRAPVPGLQERRPVQVSGALPAYPGPGARDPAAGQLLPTIKGKSFDGAVVVIEPGSRAQVIVVGAHWCPHCQAELPRLADYLRDHPAPPDVAITSLVTDTSPDRPNYPPSRWWSTLEWPGPVLADDEASAAGQALGASGFPYFVAAGADGRVVVRVTGEIGSDAFAELIERARAAR